MYIKEHKLPYDIKIFNFTTKKHKEKYDNSLSSSSLSLGSTQSSDCSTGSESLVVNYNISAETNEIISNSEVLINGVRSTKDIATQTINSNSLATSCAELLSKQWITDHTLHVYFEMLNLTVLKPNLKSVIMDPAIVYGIKVLDDYTHLLDHVNLTDNNFVIMPINNASILNDFKGSHWSVLFLDKMANTYYHYDSLSGCNVDHATVVMKKISQHLNQANPTPQLQALACEKQINTYDCGIYSICAVEKAISSIMDGQGIPTSFVNMHLSEVDLIHKRSCLAYVINNRATLSNETTIFSLMHINVKSQDPLSSNTSKTEQNRTWNTISRKGYSKVLSTQTRQEEPFQIPCSNRYKALSENNESNLEDHSVSNKPINLRNGGKSVKKSKFKSSNRQSWLNRELEILVYSDSQGRYLTDIITDCSNQQVKTSGRVMPNATTKEVFSEALEADKGPVVIVAGTNNLLMKKSVEIYSNLEEDLKLLCKTKQVLVTTIPRPFHLPEHFQEHEDQIMLNSYIKELAARIENVHVVDLDCLRRIHFTRHGLHLNYRGKRKLSYLILDKLNMHDTVSLNDSTFTSSTARQVGKNDSIQPPLNVTGQNPSFSAVNHTFQKMEQPYKSALITSRIQIINADMKEIIDIFKNDGRTAFAHCISADFGCEKQMSEGVAVCFRDKFGKPTQSNLCYENLTFQQNANEAVVYGLVTKPRFFHKPDNNVYNTAFSQLTEHFKSQKLQMLICSPLGCVRDRISPIHFAAQLVKFQQDTGAIIKIITKGEITRRILRNGLSQNDFVNFLIRSIRVEAEKYLNLHVNKKPTFSTPLASPSHNPSRSSDHLSIPPLSSTTGGSVSPVKCCEGGEKGSGVCYEVESAVCSNCENNEIVNISDNESCNVDTDKSDFLEEGIPNKT